ncbi:uncharacterized protein LOC143283491 [Babylonia areolata]|uniref:uncharacterized protein LOC143283491 n=1 Tax=Babylonia areolata TaxID=304850 RepID=UPI003FD3A401
MAPPQVDLSKKQPLEDVQGWAEKVGEQKLPPLPPLAPSAPVAVETGTTVGGRRVLAKRRCKKLIIGIVIGAVIATAITVGAFMAHRHHRHHDEVTEVTGLGEEGGGVGMEAWGAWLF